MTAAIVPSDIPKHAWPFRRRRFSNWFPLGLTYAALYMGRYNFNVSKDTIEQAYGFTNAQTGIIATAGFWTYGLSVLINGPLADKLGGRRAILFGASGACLLNFIIGMFFKVGWDSKLIMGMSILYSINMYFQSFGALSVVKVNAAWFHWRERGILGGVFGSMISLGYFFAYGVCGYILEVLPIWCVYAIPSAVILVMVVIDWTLVRNRPSDAGHDDFDTGDDPASESAQKVPFFFVVKKVLGNPVLRVLAVAEFCTGLVRQGLLLYFPKFLRQIHHIEKAGPSVCRWWFCPSDWQVASLGITVGGIVGALVCGFLSDRFFQSRRTPVAFIFYCGQIVSLFILGEVTSPHVAAFMIGVSAMWIFGVHGMLSGTASMDFGGKKAAATAAGLLDGVQYVGSGLTGFGLGWILDKFGWGVWTVSIMPFAAIGAILMLKLWNARPGKAAH